MKEFREAFESIEANAVLLKLENGELCKLAERNQIENEKGIPLYHTKITARSSKQTTENVNVAENQDEIIKELEKLKQHLKGQELIFHEVSIHQHKEQSLKVRVLSSKNYARLSRMNQANFFSATEGEPDIRIVDIPEWEKRLIYVDPEENITFILGTDYYGEMKMSMLRLAMNIARENKDSLGLHAGSKTYSLEKGGKITDTGVLVFGLSGTGKTTITMADHGLKEPEKISIRQDDIVVINNDANTYGTEKNFYVKTDSVDEQPELKKACLSENAIIENVAVKDGIPNFSDTDFCKNGRCIVPRLEIPHNPENIDMPKTDIMLFASRRYDIPIVGRLKSPEQAAAFYMLGESVRTSAGTMNPDKIGKLVRMPGFDPFIIGDKSKNGQKIYEIIKNNNIQVYLLNTGKVGGMEEGNKIKPEHTLKVIEEIIRGNIEWKYDEAIGYEVPVKVPGFDVDQFDPYKIYGKEEYTKIMEELRTERKEYLEQFNLPWAEV